MSIVEVKVPDIGDFKEVEVIELMVKPGDTIKVDHFDFLEVADVGDFDFHNAHSVSSVFI